MPSGSSPEAEVGCLTLCCAHDGFTCLISLAGGDISTLSVSTCRKPDSHAEDKPLQSCCGWHQRMLSSLQMPLRLDCMQSQEGLSAASPEALSCMLRPGMRATNSTGILPPQLHHEG